MMIVATVCLLWLACGKNGTSDRFSQVWEVIEQQPDSAKVLLADMNMPSLSEGERAEYGLLMTMVDIKTRHEQIKNDSTSNICNTIFRHNSHYIENNS